MSKIISWSKFPFAFFMLVLTLSIPFYILGFVREHPLKLLPIPLPSSALMAFCPLVAAMLLVSKEDKANGIKTLLYRIIDFRRVTKKIWYLPAVFFMPIALALSYELMQLLHRPLPSHPHLSLEKIPVLLLLFALGAIGEEVGWSGYAIDRMENDWSALKVGLIMGVFWALWHLIPYYQTNHSSFWIVWHGVVTVMLRIVIVWLYNNTGKSVGMAIVLHTTSNISYFVFPIEGSHYDPFTLALILLLAIIIIILRWGPKTLAGKPSI